MAQNPWEEYGAPTQAAKPSQGVVIRDPMKAAAEERAGVSQDISLSSEARQGRSEQFDNAKNLRDEFRKSEEAKNYEVVMRQFNSALGAKPTPTGDQALITAYAKMLDPGSVVREQEFNTVAAGDSRLGSLVAKAQKEFGVDEAGLIRPEVRNRVLQEMKNLSDSYRQSYDRVRGDYEGMAQSYGVDPKLVVGSRVDSPYVANIEKTWKTLFPQGADAQQMQISGGERYSTDTDKAIAAAVSDVFAKGGTVEDLTRAAQEAGGMVGPDDVAKFKAAVDARAKGRQVNFVPSQTGVRNPISQAVGQALMTPVGTAVTGAVNAAGLGALSLAAGDQVKGLEALNPNAGAIGEVIGGGIGAAGVGKAGAAVAGKIAPSLMGGGIAGTVGREVAQDVAAGGLTAINTGNNLTESVLTSALGSVGGQALGAGARKLLPTAKNMLGMDVPPSGGIPPSGGPDMPSGGGSGGVTPSGGAPDLGAVDDTFIPTRTRFNDGGASGTNIETIRATRAAELPVPVELAKFQRTRLFADQQKARELAKNNEVGGPIRERLAQQQEAFRQNFDRFIDSTGSEIEGDLLGKGAVVDEALRKLANVQKTRTRILYKRAEKAGETSEPVPYGNVKAFIEDQDVTTREKLAPVLDAVANQLRKNDPDGTGQIPINAMENIRKLINKVAKPGTPDETFGRDLKGLIDSATEGKGGDLYQQARAARMKYADTFENTALVKSLIGTKPGTVDRAVALEKVAEKAIYSPATSLADIKALKGVLDQASTRGQRAWQELQGATIENIRDKALTRQSDESGKLVVSPAGLQKAIEQLDKSGKLDYVFDFNTAKLLRTMSEVVNDAATAPVGSVNSSGTSAALGNMFDLIGGAATGGKSIVLKEVFKFAKNRELRKEVKRLLD